MSLADQNNSDAKELAAQLVLALFVWQFAGRGRNDKLKNFPGGAKWLVIAAFLFVGTEILALGVIGQKAWATVHFAAAGAACAARLGQS